MALNCRNTFTAGTLNALGQENINVFDAHLETQIDVFMAALNLTSEKRDVVVQKLKTTPAKNVWRDLDDDGMTAYEYVLDYATKEVFKTNKEQFARTFSSTVRAAQIHTRIQETMNWFMSDEFTKAKESISIPIPGLTNAIANAHKGNKEDLFFQVMMGLLANNNFQKGGGLEDLVTANMGAYFWTGVNKHMEAIDPKWYHQFKVKDANKDTLVKFFEDKQALAKNGEMANSTGGNGIHWELHKRMHKQFMDFVKENNRNGGDENQYNYASRPIFNPQKIEGKRDEFINELAEAIDDIMIEKMFPGETFKDISAKKKELATQVYQDVIDYKDTSIQMTETLNKNVRYMIFNSGEAEFNLRKKYSTEDAINSVYHQMERMAEQGALTKLVGASPTKFFNELSGLMNSNAELKGFVNGEGHNMFKSHLLARYDYSKINKSQLARTFSIMRNVNLLHLGYVTMDQALVEPFFALSRYMTKTDVGIVEALKATFPYLQDKQKRQVAKDWGYALESIMGASIMRFYGTAKEGLTQTSAQAMTQAFSNNFMRFMGQHWLSDGQAAGGLALFRGMVTNALNSGKKWKTLKTEQAGFVRELERAGLTEQTYNQTLQMWRNGELATEGKFDIMLLREKEMELAEAGVKTSRTRQFSTYDAWHKYFGTQVDGMARIRGGDMERMRTSWYQTDDGTTAAVIRTLMVFKTFSFGVGRRVFGRAMQDGGMMGVMGQAAAITVFTMIPAMMYIQMRELLNGRNPYDITTKEGLADVVTGAVTRMGTFGSLAVIPIVEMMIQNFTKAGFAEELFTSRDFRDDAFRQILGPVFSAWANLLIFDAPWAGGMSKLIKDPPAYANNLIEDAVKIAAPTGPIITMFRYMLLDAVEEALDPRAYNRKMKYRMKEGQNRIGNNYEWNLLD